MDFAAKLKQLGHQCKKTNTGRTDCRSRHGTAKKPLIVLYLDEPSLVLHIHLQATHDCKTTSGWNIQKVQSGTHVHDGDGEFPRKLTVNEIALLTDKLGAGWDSSTTWPGQIAFQAAAGKGKKARAQLFEQQRKLAKEKAAAQQAQALKEQQRKEKERIRATTPHPVTEVLGKMSRSQSKQKNKIVPEWNAKLTSKLQAPDVSSFKLSASGPGKGVQSVTVEITYRNIDVAVERKQTDIAAIKKATGLLP